MFIYSCVACTSIIGRLYLRNGRKSIGKTFRDDVYVCVVRCASHKPFIALTRSSRRSGFGWPEGWPPSKRFEHVWFRSRSSRSSRSSTKPTFDEKSRFFHDHCKTNHEQFKKYVRKTRPYIIMPLLYDVSDDANRSSNLFRDFKIIFFLGRTERAVCVYRTVKKKKKIRQEYQQFKS